MSKAKDQGLTVRAAIAGVPVDVMESAETLGISPERAKEIRYFTPKGISEALSLSSRLTPSKIRKLIDTKVVKDDYSLRIYAELSDVLSDEQLADTDLDIVKEFLDAGYSPEEAILISRTGHFVLIQSAKEAKTANIPLSELLEAWDIGHDGGYVLARKAEISHQVLLEVLRLTRDGVGGFRLSDYLDVVTHGAATHEQIVAMLRRYNNSRRSYYAQLLLGNKEEDRTVTHDEAIEVLECNYYLSDYWHARSAGSHAEVMEAASTGIRAKDYVTLRKDNPRVTHQEIVQAATLDNGATHSLPDYIRLIDAGYSYADIKAANMSVRIYYTLRASDHGPHLTQEQVIQVGELGIPFHQYLNLHRQGIPHEVIVANAQ